MAVAISPRWKSTVTSDAGLASMRSAKSASEAPARMRTTVLPSPRGTCTPPIDGADCCSNSWRLARFDFLGALSLTVFAFGQEASADVVPCVSAIDIPLHALEARNELLRLWDRPRIELFP